MKRVYTFYLMWAIGPDKSSCTVLSSIQLYKLAIIYELMNGHTHLSHSFIMHAFSVKLLKDSSKPMVFPIPHCPLVYGEEHWTFVYLVIHRVTLVTSPDPISLVSSHLIFYPVIHRVTLVMSPDPVSLVSSHWFPWYARTVQPTRT